MKHDNERRFTPIVAKLFRYDALNYEDGPRLWLRGYDVISETPRGYWIEDACKWPRQKRWVSKTGRKRYAHPTVQEAGVAYYHRKASFVDHSRARLRRAELEVQLVTPEGVPLDSPPRESSASLRFL